ncbi:tyrosine-type recombinase/integrase [Methyloferula stellata]|uniref:tyrosine-type recombinase/integrase n=1 Tax=Methyloferula stellata TaxID=876270 RepID=UPI00036385E3|nr:tyrosine-type recombinase/integrase [Methyloferula stellata]
MADIRFKYLVRDTSRHDTHRYYVRLPGAKKKIRIWLAPDDPGFLDAYQAAREGRQLAKPGSKGAAPQKAVLAIPGTFRALCEDYLSSTTFKADNNPIRQRTVRGILNHCWLEPISPKSPLLMGDCKIVTFGAKHVIILRDRKADTPVAANNRVREIRRVFNWKQEESPEETIYNPAAKVKMLSHETKGFHSWTLKEVAQFEAKYPIGTRPRLAFDLLLYTAQRRSDIVQFGRQHVTDDGWLVFTQNKTKTTLEIPIIEPLAESIAASAIGQMQFLVTNYGKPYSANGFGNTFRTWCDDAGLPHCSAHGLRKATSARLAELGCSEEEIGAITGHLDPDQIKVYTRAARQKLMAASAMRKLAASLNREQKSPT